MKKPTLLDRAVMASLRRFFDERAMSANLAIRNGYGAVEDSELVSFYDDLYRDLDRHLQAGPGQRVLDVGCGTGEILSRLAASSGQAIGIDIAPNMVRAARERGLDARIYDGARFPFPDAAFDRVLMNFVLINVPQATLAQRLIEEALRVLAPGGRLLVGTNPKPSQNSFAVVRDLGPYRRLRELISMRLRSRDFWVVCYDYAFFMAFFERCALSAVHVVGAAVGHPSMKGKFHVLMCK
ncbi:MAG TPA: methyltransferase domain-containing protein [Alphaproteobacteria bacterium]|nr:methyltransferase domain-containing protein [Alphaproteobacteria bacterium]